MIRIELQGNSVSDIYAQMTAFLHGAAPAVEKSEPPAPRVGESGSTAAEPVKAQASVSDSPAAPATAKRRGRPPKVKPEIASAAEAVVEEAASEQTADTSAPSALAASSAPPAPAEITLEQLREKLMSIVNGSADRTAGNKAVYDILAKYGYKLVREIKPEHYAAIHADASKVTP